MRRQDLITAFVRHPDHPVLVDGFLVTDVQVTSTNIVLHTAKPAGASPDQGPLDALRLEHSTELARVREEDRVNAESEITSIREAAAAEKAAAVEEAVATVRSEEQAGREAAIAEAVEAALANTKAEGAGA
jgi:hypothetical protein